MADKESIICLGGGWRYINTQICSAIDQENYYPRNVAFSISIANQEHPNNFG